MSPVPLSWNVIIKKLLLLRPRKDGLGSLVSTSLHCVCVKVLNGCSVGGWQGRCWQPTTSAHRIKVRALLAAKGCRFIGCVPSLIPKECNLIATPCHRHFKYLEQAAAELLGNLHSIHPGHAIF